MRTSRAQRGLEVLATIVGKAYVADEFAYLARTPAGAGNKVLQEAGKAIDDVKRVEVNEAFASVAVNSLRMLDAGSGDRERQRRRRRPRPPDRCLGRTHPDSPRSSMSCAARAAGSASRPSAPAAARATRC